MIPVHDIILSLCAMGLNALAFLMLIDNDTQLSRWKSGSYASLLSIMAVTLFDLDQTLSAVTFAIGGVIWVAIAYYRS